MKRSVSFVALFALLLLAVQSGFGWGNVTHVYYANQLGAKFGFTNMHEMYGSLLPDTYNYLFDEKGQYLYDALHTDYMPMYQNAVTREEKAIAFGFLTHNAVWGADYTAHYKGFTTPGGGYAVVKGAALAPQLVPELVTILVSAGMPSADAEGVAGMIAPEMGHDLCETAVDVLVRRQLDPLVGMRMAAAARIHTAAAGQLLSRSYADGLAAATGITRSEAEALITQVEAAYAGQMVQYGLAFSVPERQTIKILSEQFASVAAEYIKAKVGVPVEIAPALVARFIAKAILIVEPDYRREVSRTLAKLENELKNQRVTPPRCMPADNAQVMVESVNEVQPTSLGLQQNYPNPFNPSTTISYVLPADCQVSVKVYNTLGEEIAELENATRSAGVHSVVWNATGVPSGAYFCRIEAGGVVQTRRMALMK
jgi:hypothetical protein